MDPKGQVIGYVRVSSLDQNESRQLEAFSQAGLSPDEIFTDKASGKDTKRPALRDCLRYVRKGDVLVVASIDRLARNLFDLEKLVTEITGQGVTLRFLKENLVFGGDSSSPMDKLLLQMLGAVAEFERSLIKERQKEGIELARKQGRKFGRGKCVTPEQMEELNRRVRAGVPKARVAREMGISRQSVYAYLEKEESGPNQALK